MLFRVGFEPTVADAADGADAHPDDSTSSSALTTEGNVDAERPKKSLRPTQVAGESAGIFGPAGVVSCLAGAFNADPQKVSRSYLGSSGHSARYLIIAIPPQER